MFANRWAMPKLLLPAVTILLFLGAFLFRVWQFGQVPVSLYWDEMAIWNDAASIAQSGMDMHGRPALQPIFISYGDYKLPVYIWLTSLASHLTSDFMVATRLPSLLAGILIVVGVGILSYEFWKDKRLAVLTSLMAAWLPWSIHFSRVGFEGHVASALILWSIILLFKLKKAKTPKTMAILSFLVLLTATASFYTYFSARYVWPVTFAAAIIIWWPEFRKKIIWLVGIAALWVVSLQPMYHADFFADSERLRLGTPSILNKPGRDDDINYYRLLTGNNFISRVLYNRTTFLLRDLVLNLSAFFTAKFLFLSGDENLRHGTGQTGIMFMAYAPGFFWGIIQLFKKQWKLFLFLFIWWMVSLLPAAAPLTVPHALRSLNGLPVLPIVIAFGFWELWKVLKGHTRTIIFALIGALFLFEVVKYAHFYFFIYPRISADDWQDGYYQLTQYVQKNREQYGHVTIDLFDDRYYLYLQPFSGFNWDEIQPMPTVGFKRNEFHNVLIESLSSWNNFDGKTTLFISRPDVVPADAQVKDTIYGKAGSAEFMAWTK